MLRSAPVQYKIHSKVSALQDGTAGNLLQRLDGLQGNNYAFISAAITRLFTGGSWSPYLQRKTIGALRRRSMADHGRRVNANFLQSSHCAAISTPFTKSDPD